MADNERPGDGPSQQQIDDMGLIHRSRNNVASGGGLTDAELQVLTRLSEAQYGFEDKKLQQAWDVAQLNERGANARASMSAGASRAASQASAAASRYSADAGVRSSRIAAEASKYGVDINRLTDQEKIALDRELGRAGLGVDLIKTAASLNGPENVFNYVDLLRGGRDLGGLNYFLGGIMGNPNAPLSGTGAPSGVPTPMTMDSILKGLGGAAGGGVTSGGGQTDVERSADAFKQNLSGILAGGVHKFQPGSLERLNPSELGLLKGGSNKLGWNWADLEDQYQRSGIGQ